MVRRRNWGIFLPPILATISKPEDQEIRRVLAGMNPVRGRKWGVSGVVGRTGRT